MAGTSTSYCRRSMDSGTSYSGGRYRCWWYHHWYHQHTVVNGKELAAPVVPDKVPNKVDCVSTNRSRVQTGQNLGPLR